MTQTYAEKELSAARSSLERTWDRLVDRCERKLQEVDELERQIRELFPVVNGLKAA
jgi:hypothetical protein